ncbi:MAG: hypothetical protein ACXABY_21360 [Candidatus Thorarchaeota archaeon]
MPYKDKDKQRKYQRKYQKKYYQKNRAYYMDQANKRKEEIRAKIEKEMSKCKVMCCNCHAKLHHEERKRSIA